MPTPTNTKTVMTFCRIPGMKAALSQKNRGLEQRQFAEKIGMSQQQISDYCNNRGVMSLGTARYISKKLNIKIEALYEWND
ncbi:helix-turn-helix transcriptional regulator [Paenibacillus sp. y28]|uniref:helix-turn-helix transcriptional regulator n=1 Tax=Paenibacillus sp. y28 TaxID=3129110 RepID=UPI003017507B